MVFLVCVNHEDNLLILCQERFNVRTKVCQDLRARARRIFVIAQVAKLLKVCGIAGGGFVTCGETNAISANDVDNDVVFTFDGEVCPSSHSGWVDFCLVTSARPSARG